MAEEKVFLDERGIKVTSARFISLGKTHSIAGVTEVSTFIHRPERKYPIIVAAIGIILLLFKVYVFGVVLIAAGVAWWIIQKNEYSVMLSSASGNSDAFRDKDEAFIDRVVAALNDAIVHRG
ncbi:MAG: hypothetical protein HOO86_03880 [Bacteroidales bacterium]|nr:hypothetical protein [Bacteroidales bacterium]